MKYTFIPADGNVLAYTLPMAGAKPTLEELQKAVGGLIERVPVKGGYMWVNENGIAESLPVNLRATFIANQYLLGNVVLVQRAKRKHRTVSPIPASEATGGKQ